MPTRLPKMNSREAKRIAVPDCLSAYEVCLNFEGEVLEDADNLRRIRILGFLMLNAPRAVRLEVAKCIHSCQEDGHLTDLGAFFEHYLIAPFMMYRERTPEPSDDEFPGSSLGPVKNQRKVNITEAPKNHKGAKDRALIRDGWRCVATGFIDDSAPDAIVDRVDPAIPMSYTECAYIVPEAMFFGLNPSSEESPKVDYSASVLAILQQFGYDISTFNGEKVHSLINVITLEKNTHEHFDRLLFYFEATPQKNHYKLKRFTPHPPQYHMRESVTFSTRDPKNLPVPAPELLAFHATCCKVAHFSGASEHIWRLYGPDDMEAWRPDGTSGDMLNVALLSSLKYEVDDWDSNSSQA